MVSLAKTAVLLKTELHSSLQVGYNCTKAWLLQSALLETSYAESVFAVARGIPCGTRIDESSFMSTTRGWCCCSAGALVSPPDHPDRQWVSLDLPRGLRTAVHPAERLILSVWGVRAQGLHMLSTCSNPTPYRSSYVNHKCLSKTVSIG